MSTVIVLLGVLLIIMAVNKGYISDLYQAMQ